MIGLNFNEATKQSKIESLPFNIIDVDNQPFIQVNTELGERNLTTEQATAMIFCELKKKAEAHLNKTVTHALVAIPGNFNDAQRRAIIDAGAIARLKVIHMMNESTAAAIGKEIEIRSNGNKIENVLVYKLGSGSFDVRLMKINSTIDGQKIEVIASDGDMHLGGNEFNRRIMTEFIKMYNKRKIAEIYGTGIDMQLLNIEAEKAKCNLSNFRSDCVMYRNFFKPFKRSQFERLNNALFKKTINIVKNVLKAGRMDKKNVDRIILVGGSTRIPKIQQLLRDLFVGKEITFASKEDVSLGAAKRAATISGEVDAKILSLSEVSALSLGQGLVLARDRDRSNSADLYMSVVIPRNTTIPKKESRIYQTVRDDQTIINIKVYEGEHKKVKDNHFLDEFRLSGVTAAPRGVTKYTLTMELNLDGILNVTAVEIGKDNQSQIAIDYNKKRFGPADIDRMMNEIEELMKTDE